MGYDTELRGRVRASKAVSKNYLEWLDKWCDTRHSLFNVDGIKKALPFEENSLPDDEIGSFGIYYANPRPSRDLLFDDNTVNPLLGDYYFPLKVTEKSHEPNEDGTYNIEFEASGLEKPYGVDKSMNIFLDSSFVSHLGEVSGVIRGIGEEFGDAWYAIVSRGVCAVVSAYNSKAKQNALSFIGDDEVAKEAFEEVYLTEQQLEYYWE